MNFLAHAYLSFHNPSLTVGNMIADFVKGRQLLQYETQVQQGIRLHRAIDEFTDSHPSTLLARQYFQPSCGRYSAVFIDIVYDHFLATDNTIFTGDALDSFAQGVYTILDQELNNLPPEFQQMFFHMRTHNWLYNYRLMDGIYKSFNGIVRRARFLDTTAEAPFSAMKENYDKLADHYRTFFPQLVSFVKTYPH